MKIFLTGSAGCLARVLLPKLCEAPWVRAVTGVDLRESGFRHPRFRSFRFDYGGPETAQALPGYDALVHLGFRVLRGHMPERTMWRNNVLGSRKLFEFARKAGIARMVHLSSAAVYGKGEWLPETAVLSPLPDFAYAAHKAEVEDWLDNHMPEVARLRPHVILGPHAQPLLRFLLRMPVCLDLPEPEPLLQAVHEEDVARVILAALQEPVRGVFNLAAEESWTYRALLSRRYPRLVPVAPALAQGLLNGAHRLLGLGGEPGWLQGLQHTLTLDCQRAVRELGWSPVFPISELR